MNGLTKEDLEIIAECVDGDFEVNCWSRSIYDPLIAKINAMIDDYDGLKADDDE